MMDVFEVHATAKCSWFRRLFDDSETKWKVIFLNRLNIPKHMLNKNLEVETCRKCKSNVHKQALISWIKGVEPKSYKDVINQYLTYNKMIKVNKKPIFPSFFKGTINRPHDMRILNMLARQNEFLDIQ